MLYSFLREQPPKGSIKTWPVRCRKRPSLVVSFGVANLIKSIIDLLSHVKLICKAECACVWFSYQQTNLLNANYARMQMQRKERS